MGYSAKEVKDILKSFEMPDGNITAAANELCRKHFDDVEPIKNERDEERKKAQKAEEGLQELEKLKADLEKKYVLKTEYDKAVKELSDFKAAGEAKERAAAIDKAVDAYLTDNRITGNNAKIAKMALADIIKTLELDGDKLKDTKALDEQIAGTFKQMQDGEPKVIYKNVGTPPANNGAPEQKISRARQIANQMHETMFGAAPDNNTSKGENT